MPRSYEKIKSTETKNCSSKLEQNRFRCVGYAADFFDGRAAPRWRSISLKPRSAEAVTSDLEPKFLQSGSIFTSSMDLKRQLKAIPATLKSEEKPIVFVGSPVNFSG